MKQFGMTHFAVKMPRSKTSQGKAANRIKKYSALVLLGFFLIATFLTPIARAESQGSPERRREAAPSEIQTAENANTRRTENAAEAKIPPAFDGHAGSEGSGAYKREERRATENENLPAYRKMPDKDDPQYEKIPEQEREYEHRKKTNQTPRAKKKRSTRTSKNPKPSRANHPRNKVKNLKILPNTKHGPDQAAQISKCRKATAQQIFHTVSKFPQGEKGSIQG